MPFKKGNKSRTGMKNKSGQGFQKGQTAWNTGKEGLQVAWNKGLKFLHRGSFKKGHSMNLGSKRTEETKKKMRENHADCNKENNPNWQGGKSYEPYSVDWTETLKRSIRERDNYICQLCSQYGNVVHHIDENKQNCNINNLITLCAKCHRKIHNKKI